MHDLKQFSTPDDLARAAADAWWDAVSAAARAGKRFSVALSGGRITQKLFESMVTLVSTRNGSLAPVDFFWADERCVPPDHPESNYLMAEKLLFEPLNIEARQIHRIPGEKPAPQAAVDAEKDILGSVPVDRGQPVLDLVFLGLGEDGHVASLFPGEPAEVSDNPAVYRPIFNSPKPPPERVTLGFPALAAARQVWMLASGKGKENALEESLKGDGRTPFARVLRMRPQTTIFSDIG